VGNAKVLAIVKADGYGHGIVQVSQALEEAGVHGFGVAVLREALILREAAISGMILHMGRFDPQTLDTYIEKEIRLTIHGMQDIRNLEAYHTNTGKECVAHLKVDTGMTRLGVSYEEAVKVMEEIKQRPYIHLEGVWSHLATADESDLSYLRYQFVRFNQFVHLARKLKLEVPYFHLANSSGAIQDEESTFNMVRAGLLLYGVRASEHVQPAFDVLPVMDLKAPLVKVRQIAEGTPVGYGRMHRSSRKTNTGVLQIGYADGVPVSLSDKGHVELGGQVYRFMGRVSMDLTNINLGNDTPEIGEEALIWGMSEDPRLSVEHQSRLAGTIPYELLVRTGSRVERQYVED
jgi:alanine racemase